MHRLLPFLAGIAATLLLSGCARTEPSLRIGCNIWPGYEQINLAKDLGLYPTEAIQIRRLESATEVIRAFRNRAIDVAALTADEALLLAETLPEVRIFAVLDVSNGADVLLADPAIGSLSALAGRKVGVEAGALGAYMLARALERGGLRPDQIRVVSTPYNEHEAAYASHRVDAVVTFEPVRSRLLAQGARQLFDSSLIPGEIVDVLVARNETIAGRAEQIQGLFAGLAAAQDFIRKSPEEATRRMSFYENVTPDAFAASLRLLRLTDAESNRKLLRDDKDGLRPTLDRLLAAVKQQGLVRNDIPLIPGDLLDGRFFR